MTLGSSNPCASCAEPIESEVKFCPRCGHDQQIATIDLGLIDGDTASAADVSSVATGRSRLPLLLGFLGAAIVGLILFVSLRGGDTPPPEATQSVPTTAAPANSDAASARAVLGDTAVSTVAGSEASFPLFLDSTRQMIVGRRGAEVVLIDADSGAIQRLALRSSESFDEPTNGHSIGASGERLVVADTGTVRSFSLTGGADFALSGNVAAVDAREGPRVVVASQLSGVSSRTVYEVQAFGDYEIFPSESGIVPMNATVVPLGERVFFEAGGQVFEHRVALSPDGGFVSLAPGKLLGAGRNHIIVDQCSPSFECQDILIGPDSGVERVVDLPILVGSPFRISPDGTWIVAPAAGGLRATALDQSQQFDLLGVGLLAVSWTTDGRYLLASGSGSISITDTVTMETTNIDLDGTGEPFDELLVVPAPPGWTPTTD